MVTPLGLAASAFGSNNPVQPLLMDRSMEAIASSSPILAKLPNCRVMVDLGQLLLRLPSVRTPTLPMPPGNRECRVPPER